MSNISIQINELLTPSKVTTIENGALNKKWAKDDKKDWILSLFLGAMMLYTVRTIMSLCALEISKEYNYDKTQMATMLSSFFYGYPLTQIFGGYLSDRIGGDIVISYTAMVWAVLTFCLPFIAYFFNDKQLILILISFLRCLTGGFQGFHYPATSSLVSKKLVESERAFTFSFITSGQHLGTLFCGIFGSILLQTYGWEITFHFIGIMTFIWVIYYHNFVVKKYRKKWSTKEEISLDLNSSSSNELKVPWLDILSKPSFWALIVAHVCQNNAYYMLLTWLPTYFQETYPGSKGWIFNVVPWLISAPSTIFAGWLADFLIEKRISITFVRKMTAAVSLLGTGFFLFLISYVTDYSTALVTLALTIACCGFHNAGLMVNPQDLAPRYAGSVFGVMNTIGAMPGFLGVSFTGYVLETTKSWSIVFKQTAGFCFFGYAIYFIFGTGKKIIQ